MLTILEAFCEKMGQKKDVTKIQTLFQLALHTHLWTLQSVL